MDGEPNPEIEDFIKTNTVDFTENPPPPEAALMILNNNGKEILFGSLGNVSMIIGKGKAKKTFFTTAVVAAAIGAENTLGRLIGKLPEDKNNVLYFDTEQGKYHATKTANRIYRLNDKQDMPNFQMVMIKELDIIKKKEYIEYMIRRRPNVGLVVIDGIRDLVNDINNPEQASIIKDWLLMLVAKFNIHITVILHTNKNDSNARGHLGAELVNKCETVVLIEKDKKDEDISIVKFEYTRNISPDNFAFYIGMDELPYGCDIPQPNKKLQPDHLDDNEHIEIIKTVFDGHDILNKTQLIDKSMNTIEDRHEAIGKQKSRQFIDYWTNNNFINDSGTANNKKYSIY